MHFKRIEDFIREYEPFIKEWFNYNNWAKLEFNPFWLTFIEKINANNDLEKFNENHESKAQFDTWLKTVLKNFYIDQWRKLQTKSASLTDKYESIYSDGSDYEEARVHNLYREVREAEEDIKVDIDWTHVSKLMDKIENDKFRVIVKLKLFHQKYFPLNDKDYIYIEKKSDLNKEKIEEFLLEKQKEPFGMRNEDISTLLKIPEGTISTTFKRVVRKNIVIPYRDIGE